MAVRLDKTTVPGLYRRPGGTYTFCTRVNGQQKWQSYKTFDAARRAKQATSTDRDRGEFTIQQRVTLYEYITDWLPEYKGNGRRGFREESRYEYRLIIAKYYFRPKGYFPRTLKLTELDPLRVDHFVNWLAKQPGRSNETLSDSTVRNLISPLRSAMATARRQGLVKHSPVDRVALPVTVRIQEDHEQVQPFPNGTMELVIELVHPKHRLMFELLGVTGVRRSELLALFGRHLFLDGGEPFIRIRQRVGA